MPFWRKRRSSIAGLRNIQARVGATVARQVTQRHELGKYHPKNFSGWFNLAGGGAEFTIVEAVRAREVSTMLES